MGPGILSKLAARPGKRSRVLSFASTFILLAASAACAAAPIHLASISRYHHRHHYRHHRGTAQQPGLRSTEALVVDVTDHKVLYARKADVRVPIASISKLMTSL